LIRSPLLYWPSNQLVYTAQNQNSFAREHRLIRWPHFCTTESIGQLNLAVPTHPIQFL
jgi:hypothetical protein